MSNLYNKVALGPQVAAGYDNPQALFDPSNFISVADACASDSMMGALRATGETAVMGVIALEIPPLLLRVQLLGLVALATPRALLLVQARLLERA